MRLTILKIFWPYLEKRLARRAAEYLQTRRERRLGIQRAEEASDQMVETAVEESGGAWPQAILLTTIGLLVGSGLGFVLAHFINQKREGA